MLRKSAKCTFSNRFLRVADSQKHAPYEIIQLIIMSTYPKIKISCGYNYTCLLMDEIYVWGRNDEGQLGLGPPKIGTEFQLSRSPEDFCLWQKSRGHNQKQNSSQKFAPMQMNRREEGTSERGKLNLPNIKHIICGGHHTIALTN